MKNKSKPSQVVDNKGSFKNKTFITIIIAVVGTGILWNKCQQYLTFVPSVELKLEEQWSPTSTIVKDESIQPYNIEFPDMIVNDLKERLLHRRPFTPPLEDAGFKFGFNTNFLTRILDFWQNSYNVKEREDFLNKYDHYITNIQGLDIHYIHVRPTAPPGTISVPILLIHSWPSSVREFYELIPLLTKHREGHDFVFEVIVPSLPGFGFSQAPVRSGMGPIEMSVILRNLLKRIGHEKYYIHGGGLGHSVGSAMATFFPENVLGLHSNMPVLIANRYAAVYTLIGSLWPSLIVEPEEKDRIYPLLNYGQKLVKESGYFHMHATKPDTIGTALSESPAGLAAYILEKFSSWTNLGNLNASDGGLLNKISLTHLIDNVMIYWMTNTFTTSVRHYVEYFSQMEIIDQTPTEVPTWGIKFKHELLFTPDTLLKYKYHNYLHSTMVEDGGHFPAMEHPQILANDIFDAVSTFRKFHGQNTQSRETTSPELEEKPQSESKSKTVYDFTVTDINGQQVSLESYRGKVLIIVNVASQCGYTDNHYTQLNDLYDKYSSKGLRILAFPCNQFGGQEPGTLKEILQFTTKRQVKFDLFEKIDVNGENTHPLWQYLKETKDGSFGNFIKWNFSKFIIDRNGVPVERFGPNVDPIDLVPYLEKYW